jgi:hypothetical protein
MRDLTDRLVRLTQELRALRLQLKWNTFKSSSPKSQNELLQQMVDADLVEQLRLATQQLTHFLWAYVDAAARNAGPDVDFAAQSAHLAEVTDLLQKLRQTACPAADQVGFVARITLAVDRHLQAQELQYAPPERPEMRLGKSA